MTLKKITALEFRNALGEHLDRAFFGDEVFLVMRSKQPKAVLIGASQYLRLIDRLSALEQGRTPEPAQQGDEVTVTTDQLKRMMR